MAKSFEPELRKEIVELVRAGYKPKVIQGLFAARGINISTRGVYAIRVEEGVAHRRVPVNWVSTNTIKCCTCRKTFDKKSFHCGTNRIGKPAYSSKCRGCSSLERSNSLEGNLKNLLNYARRRAKVRGTSFSIDLPYLLQLWKGQDGKDYYTGKQMTYGEASRSSRQHALGPSDSSISIDEVAHGLGYTKTNVVLCANETNRTKNGAGLELLGQIVEGIKRFATSSSSLRKSSADTSSQ